MAQVAADWNSGRLRRQAVGFRDMPTAYAHEGTYRRRAKVDEFSDRNF